MPKEPQRAQHARKAAGKATQQNSPKHTERPCSTSSCQHIKQAQTRTHAHSLLFACLFACLHAHAQRSPCPSCAACCAPPLGQSSLHQTLRTGLLFSDVKDSGAARLPWLAGLEGLGWSTPSVRVVARLLQDLDFAKRVAACNGDSQSSPEQSQLRKPAAVVCGTKPEVFIGSQAAPFISMLTARLWSNPTARPASLLFTAGGVKAAPPFTYIPQRRLR